MKTQSEAYRLKAFRLQLSALIRSERLNGRMTQSELARQMGCSQQFVARLESGSSLPSVASLTSVAFALDKRLRINFREVY